MEQPAEGTKLTIHLAGGNVAKTATLEAGNEWNGGFESLAPGAYQLYEDAVSGYSPADGTGLIGINVNKDELWQAFDAGQVKTYEAVFRNERNIVQLSEGVNVSKTVQGNDHDGAFAFTLTDITTDEQKARNTGTLLRGMEGGKQTVSIGGLKDGEDKSNVHGRRQRRSAHLHHATHRRRRHLHVRGYGNATRHRMSMI